MHPALLYFPGQRLSLAEFCAARLDGHVVEIGEGYLPADTVEGNHARALSIAALVPPGTAAMGPSAAWILGAGDAPSARHHTLRSSAKRVRAIASPRLLFHEMGASRHELIDCAGVMLTSGVRTLCDLARMSSLHPDFADWARKLAAVRPELVAEALIAAEHWTRRPGKAATIAFLRELPEQQP